jgi:predicted nucleic acid-binding protein
MTITVIMDTALVAAWVDTSDKWHRQAMSIFAALRTVRAQAVFLDVVVSEVIGVITRRMAEQQRLHQFESVLDLIEQQIPADEIIWLSDSLSDSYPAVMYLVRAYQGELNFNDALIALGARELNIQYIASFDRDFDQIPWLKRIGTPADVPAA